MNNGCIIVLVTMLDDEWTVGITRDSPNAINHRGLDMVNIPPIKMVMTGGLFMALFYPHRILTSINWDMTPTTMVFLTHKIVSGSAPQVVRCSRESVVNPGGSNITKTDNGIFTGYVER